MAHKRSEVVNDGPQKRVLVHRGLRGAALHRASPERIGQIEDELLDADPSAQAEAKKVVGATLSRLRIVEESGPQGDDQLGLYPQILCAQADTRGVVPLATQYSSPLAGVGEGQLSPRFVSILGSTTS